MELLQHIKANHEKWVAACLTEEEKVAPVRIRRIRENLPTHLPRLSAGREVMAIVEGACASAMDHDELISDEEVAFLGGFLQELRDWGDLGADLEPADRVRETFSLTKTIKELGEAGFMVFGGREIQRLQGGLTSPTNWPIAIIRVVRTTSAEIISVELPKDTTTAGIETQE